MLVGWLAAWHLGAPVARGIGRWLPATAARGAAGVLLFLGFSILAGWIGHRLLAAKRVSGVVRSPPDRGAGALLGGAKAGLFVWIALSGLALAGGRVSLGRYAVDGRGSDLAALAKRHNLLSSWTPVTGRAVERLFGELRDPARRPRLVEDPAVQRLLKDPRFRSFVDGRPGTKGTDRDEVERARQALELLDDPAVRGLLERYGTELPEGADGPGDAPVPKGAARAR
jgi:membrane protein required for colicin V production